MAPKPVPGKKGQVDQEDFSDVATLPPLNSYLVSLLFNGFFSEETREKAQKYVMEHLAVERVKTLTRDEIIAYGKTKLIILEPTQVATLPPDDPRLKLSEADQLAKAAVEKLFELSVHARRAKKERLAKQEEEAKVLNQPFQPDTDQLDIVMNLVEYPNTKAEALSLSKYSTSLNCLFHINQVRKEPQSEEDQQNELFRQQERAPRQEDFLNAKAQDRLNQLLEARDSSIKGSPIRNLAVVKLDFTNVAIVDYVLNDQGDEVEQTVEPEVDFSHELNGKLEQYGALFIKYLRFRDKVQLMPLAPDRQLAEQLRYLHLQGEDYQHWLEEVSTQLNETLNQSQRDAMDAQQQEEYSRNKRELEEMKNQKAQIEEQRKQTEKEVKQRLTKESTDETNFIKEFKLKKYDESFLPYKESQNSISSIMSAMVSQIADENNFTQGQSYSPYQQEVSTEAETIDDDINKMFDELQYDSGNQYRQYGQDPSTQEIINDIHHLVSREAVFRNDYARQATQAFLSQPTMLGDVDYDEELDQVKKNIQKIPKGLKKDEAKLVEDICAREYELFENLQLPGFKRHMMPPIPSKSQKVRQAERPQLYPFSTLPIEETERGLILRAFQELLKANQIDEGLSGEQKPNKYKPFDRHFETHMSSNILKQVIADAMLTDPDIATLYYQRDDALLLALYNKVHVQLQDRNQNDGEKLWRSAYRTMPDFENWLKYFSDELVVQQPSSVPNAVPKYQLDEEMIPETLLDMDDKKIGAIEEKTEQFYLNDGGIIKIDTFTVGGQSYKKSCVIKDNIKFGLRKKRPETTEIPEEEKEYGLVSHQSWVDSELWVQFENDTRITVEQFKYIRNPQRLIRIDPPKPTPEEIAAREEAIKLAQAAAAKNKGKAGSALANQPIIEEYKEPEPTWEPEELDQLDNQFDYSFDYVHSIATSTFSNGLMVQHTTAGNIIQTTEDLIFNKSPLSEKDRVFLQSAPGVVVRHFNNRDAEVLYPNGNRATFNKKDMMWIVTNNKGMRRAKKSGIQWDMEPISCAYETDAVTNAKMMVREDKVMTIRYADGSLFCQHIDGTIMKTSAIGNEIRIEKEGYAPVIIKNSLTEQSDIDNSKQTSAEQRAKDGIVFETHLPDGSIAETYTDAMPQWELITMFRRPDFTCVVFLENGQIQLCSANHRSALNEEFSKKLMGQDWKYFDYFTFNGQYFSMNPIEIGSGKYTAKLQKNSSESPDTSLILCQDKPQNMYFQVYHHDHYRSGDDRHQHQGTEYSDWQLKKQQQATNNSGGAQEIEDVGGYKNPRFKHFLMPRLFVIKADGSGYELQAKEQLEYYLRNAKTKKESIKQTKQILIGNCSAKAHYIVTKVKTLQDKMQEMLQLKSLPFPQNALYALLHTKKGAAPSALDVQGTAYDLPDHYLFRQIFEFNEFEPFKQEAFYDDLERFKKWKISQVRYDTEFGIIHVPAKDQQIDLKKINEEEFFAKRITLKILKERRNMRKRFNPLEFKDQYVNEFQNNQEINEYHRRVTLNLDKPSAKESARGGAISKRQDPNNDSILDNRYASGATSQLLEAKNQDQIRNIKKKQEANIQNQLQDIRRMINTPTFIPTYFQSKEGQSFTKNNPEKPPSQEMLLRMSQRINRSQQNTDKGANSHGENSPLHNADPGFNQDNKTGEEKESPIVALEPEDHMKQGSAFMGTKNQTDANGGGPMPSLYLQEKMYLKQREQEHLLKSEEYHVVKTKDFNVVGRLRQDKPFVKAIQKSTAQAELNEKFITTECIADRRVKISSMAPRQYMQAPSVEDVRKQGQHQMILGAINKKQTFAELINTANAMVTSVLHDPLKRSFNIMPGSVKFGTICAGQAYELILTMKNEDQVGQRVTIKPMNDRRINVQQLETGPIAPGMIRKISVTIQVPEDEECTIKETLQILTKTDIFKIPIEAIILNAENYQKEFQEQQALNGKSLTNSRVRNKLNSSIQRGRMSAKGERKASGFEGADGDEIGSAFERNSAMGGNGQQRAQWIETTNSESKLPQIPQIDKRPFEINPKKPLKELLKK